MHQNLGRLHRVDHHFSPALHDTQRTPECGTREKDTTLSPAPTSHLSASAEGESASPSTRTTPPAGCGQRSACTARACTPRRLERRFCHSAAPTPSSRRFTTERKVSSQCQNSRRRLASPPCVLSRAAVVSSPKGVSAHSLRGLDRFAPARARAAAAPQGKAGLSFPLAHRLSGSETLKRAHRAGWGSACCYWNGHGTQCNHPAQK